MHGVEDDARIHAGNIFSTCLGQVIHHDPFRVMETWMEFSGQLCESAKLSLFPTDILLTSLRNLDNWMELEEEESNEIVRSKMKGNRRNMDFNLSIPNLHSDSRLIVESAYFIVRTISNSIICKKIFSKRKYVS